MLPAFLSVGIRKGAGMSKEPELDIAKLCAEAAAMSSALPAQHIRTVHKHIRENGTFEKKGLIYKEDVGHDIFIQDVELMGYEVNVFVNYKPYYAGLKLLHAGKKALIEHEKACIRDGWGKIFVVLTDDLDSAGDEYEEGRAATALTILEGMKYEAWGKYSTLVEFANFEGF
jgi:hypothetical protein